MPRGEGGRDRVRKVQTALNQQGFNVGDPDGKLGKRTKEALIAFQKQRGFQTTGKIDHTTLQALVAGAPGPSQSNNAENGGTGTSSVPQATPQSVAPNTTGQGSSRAIDQATEQAAGQGASQPAAMVPQPAENGTVPAPEGLQVPDTSASGRVPAGSPQEDYRDDSIPPATDPR